jgi:hypothetical protein
MEDLPGSNHPQRAVLGPEELEALRKLVKRRQLQTFNPEVLPLPGTGPRRRRTASRPEPASPVPTLAVNPVAENPPLPPQPRTPAPAAEILLPEQISPSPEAVRKDITVSNIETILKEAMQIDGALGVALVDYTSGMTLGQSGGSTLNLDVAAAGNTEVVRAKLRTMESLGLRDGIEDILITLTSQYHVLRLIQDKSGLGLFLYLALDRSKANLALARHKLATLETQIEI